MDGSCNCTTNGIRCDVKNCVYNNGCNCCTAEHIHVTHDGIDPQNTCCETFAEG